MAILGHGIDLVEKQRIGEMIQRHGEHFLLRVFTENERQYAENSTKRADEHFAARFAAKEAALKALGTGWRHGIAWTDIEVVRMPTGQPRLHLHGMAKKIADDLGIHHWHISLTHTQTHAVASVIAEGLKSEHHRLLST